MKFPRFAITGSVRRGPLLVLAGVCIFAAGSVTTLLLTGEAWTPPAATGAVPLAPPSPPRQPTDDTLPGRWRRNRAASQDAARLEEELQERVLSVGYLAGSESATKREGVTIHDSDRSFAGLNLCCSGHACEAILMDMAGYVRHTWHKPFNEVWPDCTTEFPGTASREYWRRVFLLDGGDLLAIYEGAGLVRLDKDSNVVWAYDGWAHHDLAVDGNRLHVLVRSVVPGNANDRGPDRYDDFIVTLDLATGEERSRFSILDAFASSQYRHMTRVLPQSGELLHTNTVELLDGRLAAKCPQFAAGNLLISLWVQNAVAVVDPRSRQVVWAVQGLWTKQHDPQIIGNGNLLVFDNLDENKSSQVVEIDPFTQRIEWEYRGTPPESFFTATCGLCQRLPNGNTLATESENGRAIEVTRDGEIVWEYVNPHHAGPGDALVATLFQVRRVTLDSSKGWLSRGEGQE